MPTALITPEVYSEPRRQGGSPIQPTRPVITLDGDASSDVLDPGSGSSFVPGRILGNA